MAIVCLSLVNDLSWAIPLLEPGSRTSSKSLNLVHSTLAAQSRFKPFFEKHGLNFQNMAAVIYASGRLRELLIDENELDEITIKREINRLNRLFPNGAVRIREEIQDGRLKGSDRKDGKAFKSAVFDFVKEGKAFDVLFLSDHANLAPEELAELRIKDDEKYHLDSPGLEGVWFVNRSKPESELRFSDGKALIDYVTNFNQQRKAFSVSYKDGMYILEIAGTIKALDPINDDIKRDYFEIFGDAGGDALYMENAAADFKDKMNCSLRDFVRNENVLIIGPGDSLADLRAFNFSAPHTATIVVIERDLKSIMGCVKDYIRLPEYLKRKTVIMRDDFIQTNVERRFKMVYSRGVLVEEIQEEQSHEAFLKALDMVRPGGVLLGELRLRLGDLAQYGVSIIHHSIFFSILLKGEEPSGKSGSASEATGLTAKPAQDEPPIEGGMADVAARERWIAEANEGSEEAPQNIITHVEKAIPPETRPGEIEYISTCLTDVAMRQQFLAATQPAAATGGVSPNNASPNIKGTGPGLSSEPSVIGIVDESLKKDKGDEKGVEREGKEDGMDKGVERGVSGVEVAAKIHAENLKYPPDIPKKTILCHITADSILPDAQQKNGILNRLDIAMRDKSYNEKVVELKVDGSKDFIRQVRDRIQEVENYYRAEYGEEEYENYTFEFDVACPSTQIVARVQKELGLPALAFSRREGDIVQLEGIILALRALHSGEIDRLRAAYRFLTGEESVTDTNDINEFARRATFILPAAKSIDYDEDGRLSRLIEENIKTAA